MSVQPEPECTRCHDNGYIPGTYRLCNCTAVPRSLDPRTSVKVLGVLGKTITGRTPGRPEMQQMPDHPFAAQLSVIDGAPTKVCGIKVDGVLCHRREEEHHEH